MMKTEKQLYQEIADRMAFGVPRTAAAAVYTGKIYASHEQCGLSWIEANGAPKTFEFGKRPENIESELREKIGAIRDMFSAQGGERWTHFNVLLKRGSQIEFSFAYIPEDDDWVGVFMRRVSDLTLEEAKAAYIPEKNWREFCRKRFEAESSPSTS
jgi:hypothetical protein